MCGIFIQTIEKKDDVLQCMSSLNMLKGRGPESSRFIVDNEKIFIGFRRLPIIDVSGGEQPFVNGNRVLVANAEIFNHHEIEKTLNLNCQSKSDCECILRAIENGIKVQDIARMLNGDFAFVIVDETTITVCRDRVGIRPLFYGFKNGQLAISSEIKAFPDGFNVEHVQPSTVMTFDIVTKNFSCIKYYDVYFSDKLWFKISPSPCIKTLLINSVKLRLESERPVGCLLSGGLDSSIVALILSQLIGPKNLRTYSIGMKGSIDLKYARIVADFLGTQHSEIIFTPEEGIRAIPDVINALESYDITTVRASIPMYLLGKWIKQNTNDKVIFSGELSDELLCGYLYFHHSPSDEEAENESKRLVENVYKYDALRADRCISSHGLELRVPFADVNVINYCMFILTGKDKRPNKTIEKKLLRDAFNGELPNEILWRKKDGFSDGVSSLEKPWYTHIQDYIDTLNIPLSQNEVSKEAQYYKQIYNTYYSQINYNPITEHWMPKWGIVDKTNPSGRIIKIESA